MSWKTFEDYKKEANRQALAGRRQNEEIGAFYALVNQRTVDAAKRNKKTYSDPSNMLANRRAEKEVLAQNGRVFPDAENAAPALPEEQKAQPVQEPQPQTQRSKRSLEEVLDDDRW